TPTYTVTADVDPVKNDWNLGPGSDAPPAGTAPQGYGTEIRWDLNALAAQGKLLSGHRDRFHVIGHDGGQNKAGGDHAEARVVYDGPASVSGSVYADLNNDGVKQTTESGISGTTVTLTGTNDLGAAVNQTTTTDGTGAYSFSGLRPGVYTLTETQPAGWLDGK